MAIVKIAAISFILSLTVFQFANPLSLENNGGYHIEIAIDPSIDQSSIGNIDAYISGIRNSFQIFSTKLWGATEGRFFINSVNLLTPSHWVFSPEIPVSQKSYEASDIKLSEQFETPIVHNPNPCGSPGQYIQLPVKFFDNPNEGTYGIAWKVLLNQWARYRWGVWEEHGYPYPVEQNNFPYFYQNKLDDATKWIPNTCSNTELTGKYEHFNGDEACNENDETTLSPSCRFIPDPSNTASTSLMSFHFLNTVEKFCDGNTHNKMAPNAQNWFCNYKSITEVMRETKDYNDVTEPLENDLPIIKFNVMKANSLPAFYLLIDRGYADSGATNIVTEVIRTLVNLYDLQSILPKNILTAFGTFPGESGSLNHEVDWTVLSGNEDTFIEAMGHVFVNGTEDRNFGTALEELSQRINEVDFPNGVFVLLVKTQAPNTTFETIKSEDHIFTTFFEKKIRLFTIEVPHAGSESPQLALQRLTTQLGGTYVGLQDIGTLPQRVGGLLNDISEQIETPISYPLSLISYSNYVNLSSTDPISINIGTRQSTVNFFVTMNYDVDTNTMINLDGSSDYSVETLDEWNMKSRYIRRVTHNYNERDTGELRLRLNCESSNLDGCNQEAYLLVIEVLSKPLENDIRLSVSTSADTNDIDFSSDLPELSQFSVYAKVEADGKPVSGVRVSATFTSTTGAKQTIELFDDGLGVPDVSQNDGIYSNIFIPNLNGEYTLLVKLETEAEQSMISQAASRLLPVDQGVIGCGETGCETVPLVETIATVRNFPSTFVFRNVGLYPNKDKPVKVLDFQAINDVDNGFVNFTFTSPKVLGSAGSATKYVIKGSRTHEGFFSETPDVVNVLTQFEEVPPGTKMHISTPVYAELYYYALISYNGDIESSLSPIARITGEPVVSEPLPSTTPGEQTSSGASEDPGNESSTEAGEDEDKPFFKTAGGIVVIVVIVLAVIAAAGGGFWYYKKKQSRSSSNYV